ncbi:MAG: 50S ribosomal protein L29 [Planctomycetes bacterium]|nr:50S ribosomal protein L29 [Planctomycetota bacterium]
MNLEEIRGLATDDLSKAVEDAREEMFRKRFQTAMEAVDNTAAVRELRKRVARLKTVLRERELAAAKQGK